MLKTDVNTEGVIFHLNHLPPQGFCPHQRTTFYIISPAIQSYLCVNFSVNIPKNTQCKWFSEISWLCHTSKELHAFWTWYLLVVLCWLWEYLDNSWYQQAVLNQPQVMFMTQSCMLIFLKIKMPKTAIQKYSSREILVNVSDTWFSHPLLQANVFLKTSLVWETKQHKRLIWIAPAGARSGWCLEMISWRQPLINLSIIFDAVLQTSSLILYLKLAWGYLCGQCPAQQPA